MRPPPSCGDQCGRLRPDHRSPSAGERTVSRALSVPRCGVSSPFKGHLSVKSNAFYIGHNSRLSDQYRIRDHMLVHYDKIIAAKAAVDCSVPKSMIKSIKYSDQQRRERMNREVTRLEKESLQYGSFSRPNSRANAEDSIIHGKDTYDGYANMVRQSPYSDRRTVSSAGSYISSPSPLRSPVGTAAPQGRAIAFSRMSARMRCGFSDSREWSSSASCQFRDNLTKTYSGDLLEKHSRYFSNQQHPHTPRTLRTPAKSVIAQYRYYTPPRRKRKEIVAEPRADISRFQQRGQAQEEQPPSDREQEEHTDNMSEEEKIDHQVCDEPTDRQQRTLSREEELAYLGFVVAVTNEILTLGLFSDRVLERVFERHFQVNKNHLDEGKMRYLLDILKADLNRKDENSLQSFIDHLSDTSEHFTSSSAHRDVEGNEGSRSQGNFSQYSINYGQRLRADLLKYPDSESHLLDHLTSLDISKGDHEQQNKQEHEPEDDLLMFIKERNILQNEREVQLPPDVALPCLHERESDLLREHRRESDLGFLDVQGCSDHRLLDDQGESDHGLLDDRGCSDHRLPDDRGESDHGLQDDGLQVSERTFDVDNLPLEDSGEDQIGSHPSRPSASANLPEGSHHLKTDQLNNLEDLEQSFSEIVHVSSGKEDSDPGDEADGERDYDKICEQSDL